MRYKLCCLLALLLLSSCSSSQAYRKDNARLESSLANVRSFQAEQTNQINTLQSQIQRLSGRIEELEYVLKRRGQMAGGGDMPGGVSGGAPGTAGLPADPAIVNPGTKPLPPSMVPLAPLEDDENFARSLPANPSRLLTQALGRIRQGNFQDSLTLLQQMVQQGERSEWLPNVLFWLGVTYDGLKEDRNALRSYNDLVVQFPRHRRVPLALLRQADVLKRLGDSKNATLLLRKVLTDYPDTSEGDRAREELKKF